jgi:hypothetical protein
MRFIPKSWWGKAIVTAYVAVYLFKFIPAAVGVGSHLGFFDGFWIVAKMANYLLLWPVWLVLNWLQ